MLYPQNNKCRSVIDLSGIWDFKPDPHNQGETEKWYLGFDADVFIGVPGSWNEQMAELGLMNYVGKVWYQTRFYADEIGQNHELFLRIGAADFNAKVWINGKFIGSHSGGYLPFEFHISEFVDQGEQNSLVICNDNFLDHDSIPQGISESDYNEFGKQRELSYPATIFDFFAYGGLTRHIHLSTRSKFSLETIQVKTTISDKTGYIKVKCEYRTLPPKGKIELHLKDDNKDICCREIDSAERFSETEMEIKNCIFWDTNNPHLYQMEISLYNEDRLLDTYSQMIGVREIKIEDNKLLLNGKPLFLTGFGKHEDFAVLGRGLSYPLMIKDFQLMRWIGANSFRTSHYPYSEEIMHLADKMGFLVIDEVPAVSLNFRYVNEKTLENHKKNLTDLIARDRNHPCVISWSIANEPGIWGEEEALSAKADKYWKEIYQHVKNLDDSRPITLPACAKWGVDDLSYKYSDFISINRYWGWYEVPGDMEKAGEMLEKEMINLFEKYQKPIMLTEFGADTVEGLHATFPQLFTEEYQIEFTLKYFAVIESLPFTIGEHIWNFADFRTAQHFRRVVLNKKGIFTRQRDPKSAAFAIRKHWNKDI
jgi:beta-glucuronidase